MNENLEQCLQHYRDAGCTTRQMDVVRLRLSGMRQLDIARSLGMSQPMVCGHLMRVRGKLASYAKRTDTERSQGARDVPEGFERRIEFYRWLWHTVCGDIEENGVVPTWRRATIGSGPQFDPALDDKGAPVHLRVLLFRPEDML